MPKQKMLLFVYMIVLLGSHYPPIYPTMKTSLIVPCAAQHAQHLHEILAHYETQTLLPDEIVISLSEYRNVDPTIIETLQEQPWPFPVLLLLSEQKAFAGINRNMACQHATGDIFICQDADDIPHPQRVEIIKYFFEKYNLDLLAHSFVWQDSPQSFDEQRGKSIKDFQWYTSLETVPFQFTNNWREAHNKLFIHNGVIAINKKVFDAVNWSDKKRGQDVEFTKKIFAQYKAVLVVNAPLYIYKNFNSTLFSNTPTQNDSYKQVLQNTIDTRPINVYMTQTKIIL